MKKLLLIFTLVLLASLFFIWQVFQSVEKVPADSPKEAEVQSATPNTAEELNEGPASPPVSSDTSDTFPPPTTEVVNGRTERTIHMGVRQYAWDPSTITAKEGELVRLIIHNADVKHGLVIPDLGIMEGDIPPEGAVIEFTPGKVGTFKFFCSVYCGEGHMEMRGKIIVEDS